MQIQKLDYDFSICKVPEYTPADLSREYSFLGKTEEEKSMVCMTEHVPESAIARDDGWKAFRVKGVLDFSLVGVLAEIATLLSKNRISIFAVSTYNTDYVFTKKADFEKAWEVLLQAGYQEYETEAAMQA